MIESYNELPPMYKAHLSNMELVIVEVSPHCYMRTGTQGMARTKLGAIEILKKGIMDQFAHDLKCIDWQAQQYIKGE